MPQFLVTVYHPDDYDPSVESEAMIEKIRALNRARVPSPAVRRARCASFCSARLQHKNPAEACKWRVADRF